MTTTSPSINGDWETERNERLQQLEQHYASIGLAERHPKHQRDGRPRKPVVVNGIRYSNATDAAIALGVSEGTIRDVARGERKTKLFTARWA